MIELVESLELDALRPFLDRLTYDCDPGSVKIYQAADPVLRDHGFTIYNCAPDSNNRILLHGDFEKKVSRTINYHFTRDNTVFIGRASTLGLSVSFLCNDGIVFDCGQTCWPSTAAVELKGQSAVFSFGEGSSVYQMHATCEGPDGPILIGEDCMFSTDIELFAGDGHAIFDILSRTKLNPARPILIEDHVWIGRGASVMKGCTIGRGSIIGAMSVVTKDVMARSAVVGNPARRARSGVSWARPSTASPMQMQAIIDRFRL